MKTFFLVGLVLALIFQWVSANDNATTGMVSGHDSRVKLINLAGRNLKHLLMKFWNQNENSDGFVGRCFGIAKKIRAILPIAIFMMGVIMTLLAFLTLFSLKSLGMLGLLLLINTSGAVAKVVAALSHKHDSKTPQDVHFHIHQNKHGEYDIGHSGYGWADDRTGQSGPDRSLDRLQSYNLYNKLLTNPSLREYRNIDR
ncbi:hypothetical protein JTB14_016294 [Gonioctena quinquepunctata]|nr:hypothetical protein JTB14_016294 [Gonioctena quinquepunctata]